MQPWPAKGAEQVGGFLAWSNCVVVFPYDQKGANRPKPPKTVKNRQNRQKPPKTVKNRQNCNVYCFITFFLVVKTVRNRQKPSKTVKNIQKHTKSIFEKIKMKKCDVWFLFGFAQCYKNRQNVTKPFMCPARSSPPGAKRATCVSNFFFLGNQWKSKFFLGANPPLVNPPLLKVWV